ncbi:NADPH-dependent oxidoreductase [Cohnella fermenti]|uniref:NADPH-dependent oxidoreductase n=1 Tax=Cohnella fermenti TaxID=2565925 RepID=A0A4S4C7N0_9BACL|nr:NADPH-dependent oxidoreductase [Cohnella fermenti]THF83304.1 NADPH-dependent oxidoreductase [Cohnella fermenti]
MSHSDIVSFIKSHRSIRKFKREEVTDEQVAHILAAAQSAPTSSNIQAYSVVGVRDPETKRRFAELAGGQRHIEESGIFLVWCADLNRLQSAIRLEEQNGELELPQNLETFLLASIDATLAAQNATIAAEALGFGTVYIGGIRNNPRLASELLGLPRLVYPVFGHCIGVPDQEPTPRPRLPVEAVYHRETYSAEAFEPSIRQYDRATGNYYAWRTGGSKDTYWSKEMASRFRKERLRGHLHGFLEEQGFRLD